MATLQFCIGLSGGFCVGWLARGDRISNVFVFDVNETLLDLDGLRHRFEAVLPSDLMGGWFSAMLRNSMLASMTGHYASFDEQGVDALFTLGKAHGVDISSAQAEYVLAGLEELEAHRDVVPALNSMARKGMRCAALSNSSSRVLSAQMANSGLGAYFERLISVEEVGLFKPAPEVYIHAAGKLGVDIGDMWMVAAHDWDITGAIRAGAKGAFIDRGGGAHSLLGEKPDISGPDMGDVVRQILAVT